MVVVIGAAAASHICHSPSQSYFVWRRHLEIEWTVTSYLQCQADDEMDENHLLFWKTHVQFEHLKPVAKTVLTRSASSIAVECMFSTMGLILNGTLYRLSGDRANAISFIHDNFAFLDMV